ncbi:MAG TPA: aminoglycoside phosphotransferase family protein [Phycisphaerales bacterium]|nr:aminoglycoside phosphotransferase family protein [Phycisphaerales bacterium]
MAQPDTHGSGTTPPPGAGATAGGGLASASPHDRRPAQGGSSELAAALEPALLAGLGGTLSPVSWFVSSWQAGGAATGFATLKLPHLPPADVVVKLPVGPAEYRWTTELSPPLCVPERDDDGPICTDHEHDHPPTLRVLASGTEVGGYDLAWLVVERLPGHTLQHDLTEQDVRDLLHAAARLYQHAGAIRPVDRPPAVRDWEVLLARAREACKTHQIAGAQHWNDAIKHVQKALPRLLARWESRAINTWCHGDLHPGNAMRRPGNPGSCVLLDLALVHPGHWVEDAVYLERLYWGRPELLHGIKPVSHLAQLRREMGLEAGDDYATLANIRRVMMAATSPAFLEREGHPKYLKAALEVLEKLLPQVVKA